MSNYRLPLVIEPLEEGGYLATSPVLPGLLVQADTVEEALALAPGVARALIEAMQEKGVSLPVGLQAVEAPPFRTEVLVPA
jgi:antitoxin HicB